MHQGYLNNRKIVGTLVNKLSSKQTQNKEKIAEYTVPFICEEKHIPIVEEGIKFLLNQENYNQNANNVKIIDLLRRKKPCGFKEQIDWKKIQDHYNLAAHVHNFGFIKENKTLQPSYGRAFVACCYRHLFECDEKTKPDQIITKALNHMSMNTDLAYHTFTISPPQQVHKGLLLQATESGLVVTTDGSYRACGSTHQPFFFKTEFPEYSPEFSGNPPRKFLEISVC